MITLPTGKQDGIQATVQEKVLTLQIQHAKDTNPFSRKMTLALRDVSLRINSVPEEIEAVVITGGAGRSFSVGGDFKDVSALQERVQMREYLFEIIDLYNAILSIEVPVVSAIDHYAIGQGLQVALLGDWRMGTGRTQMRMPELKNGVACPLGAVILQELYGRDYMLKCVVGCAPILSEEALARGMLSEIVPEAQLLESAHRKARELAGYPRVPFRMTKIFYNQRLIQTLNLSREGAAQAHIASFLAASGAAHFEKILGTPSP